MSPPLVASEQLRALVNVAADGTDENARALLRAVLPLLTDVVTSVLVEVEDGQLAGEQIGLRNQILDEVSARVIARPFLAQWRAAKVKDTWLFIEGWTHKFAQGLRDHAWVRRALDVREPTARTTLFTRLQRLFERAARRRSLRADECEEAFQSFSVWLLADGCRALLRWDPEGGRSFDGWFFARALNQIDTQRRVAAASEVLELDENDAFHDDGHVPARLQLQRIEHWLKQNCKDRQYEIFIRRIIEEQSAAEIAAAMDMQPGVVYMTILRLRKALAILNDA